MERSVGIKHWSYQDSMELYAIKEWGNDFFSVNEKGEVIVHLGYGEHKNWVSLHEIAKGLDERGLGLPVLLRFSDILRTRIENLNEAFRAKIKEYGYKNEYRGVYPVKVNQQQEVIEEITRHGKKYHHGLEAGSKAELLVALSHIQDSEALVICNGYKDNEFIDIALYSLKLGYKTFIVIERPAELKAVIARAKALGVTPNVGIRVKLSATGVGKWSESAGDHSVFGLTASQILDAIDFLKQENMLHCLMLLHYHLGSQIPDIKSIRLAVSEAVRYYVEIAKEGAPLGYIDIGGGLAIDYDGSKSSYTHSKNYSLAEYCSDVVEVIMEIVDEAEVPHPVIVTESGRAVVAYYSVLIFNILDVNKLNYIEYPESALKDVHQNVTNLNDISRTLSVKNLQEMYHDAVYYRDELRSLFLVGEVTLRERGMADQLFWKIVSKITKLTSGLKHVPEELQDLDKLLADIYYGNFSLFQSLPDSWAIDQLFPIMPIHRLNEKPTVQAIIADTTCDCDGKIDKFIDLYDVKSSLPLHELVPDEEYILGTFLIGAYQETLGDLHNLFGDTNVVSISVDENGEIHFENELDGDSVADVLTYVEYDPKVVLEKIRRAAELSVKNKLITPQERKEILQVFEQGLGGYTYFEK